MLEHAVFCQFSAFFPPLLSSLSVVSNEELDRRFARLFVPHKTLEQHHHHVWLSFIHITESQIVVAKVDDDETTTKRSIDGEQNSGESSV